MVNIINFFAVLFFCALLLFIAISSILFLVEKIFSGLSYITSGTRIDFSLLESIVYDCRNCSVDIMTGLIPITIFLIIIYGLLNGIFV